MVSNNTNSDELDNFFYSLVGNGNNKDEILTIAAIEDKLVATISSYNTADVDKNGIHIKWHYLDQARALIYRINVYDPLSEFVIFTSDIPEWVLEELSRCGKAAMKMIITNAVRRIYESVDPDYFHINGIYGKVRWRFAASK